MPNRHKLYTIEKFERDERELMEHKEEGDEDCPSEADVLDEVLADWFPNAKSEAELDYELECLSWGDD